MRPCLLAHPLLFNVGRFSTSEMCDCIHTALSQSDHVACSACLSKHAVRMVGSLMAVVPWLLVLFPPAKEKKLCASAFIPISFVPNSAICAALRVLDMLMQATSVISQLVRSFVCNSIETGTDHVSYISSARIGTLTIRISFTKRTWDHVSTIRSIVIDGQYPSSIARVSKDS